MGEGGLRGAEAVLQCLQYWRGSVGQERPCGAVALGPGSWGPAQGCWWMPYGRAGASGWTWSASLPWAASEGPRDLFSLLISNGCHGYPYCYTELFVATAVAVAVSCFVLFSLIAFVLFICFLLPLFLLYAFSVCLRRLNAVCECTHGVIRTISVCHELETWRRDWWVGGNLRGGGKRGGKRGKKRKRKCICVNSVMIH